MPVFISNDVGVNSIEEGWVIPAGWSVITEAEARKLNPDLFGEAVEAPVKPLKAVKPTETN